MGQHSPSLLHPFSPIHQAITIHLAAGGHSHSHSFPTPWKIWYITHDIHSLHQCSYTALAMDGTSPSRACFLLYTVRSRAVEQTEFSHAANQCMS